MAPARQTRPGAAVARGPKPQGAQPSSITLRGLAECVHYAQAALALQPMIGPSMGCRVRSIQEAALPDFRRLVAGGSHRLSARSSSRAGRRYRLLWTAARAGWFKRGYHLKVWLASTPAGRRPQIGRFHAGGSLASATSAPGTLLVSPARKSGCRATAKALTQRVFSRQRRDTASEHLDSNAFARVASRRVPGFKRGSRRPCSLARSRGRDRGCSECGRG